VRRKQFFPQPAARSSGWLLLALIVVAGCTTSTDVTQVGGSPVGTQTPPEQTPPAGEVTSAAGAPACTGFADASASDGLALPCLGPGPPIALDTIAEPTVVAVWASWCAPCRDELPILQEFHEQGGAVLGIDAADATDPAAALAQELQLTFPSVQDPASMTRTSLGWAALPATFIVKSGRVVHRFSEPITSIAQVDQALASSGPRS